ncbi:MAG TPA: FAD:protein FMN transferase [Gemmatimonadaceae bacterium]|jgi:thiamine biosynthesis lipoprotein|nr:FAD:protein FMN transferase [Gemmatimonadaceae bacterium]
MRAALTERIGKISAWLPRRPVSRAARHVWHYEGVLGTSLELQVVAEGDDAARRAESAALDEVDRLEAILSGWSATSELARWLATHDVDTPVSSDLAEVLRASGEWRERTAGAFDPAAETVAERLRNGDGPDPLLQPADPLWVVDRLAGTARRRSRHAVSLDAIAKGYIVARAAERARSAEGVSDVLLNVGGDIQHLGDRPVMVRIADPCAPAENAPPIAAVRIRNEGLATSGGYRRGFVVDGRRVSHIVDPRSGEPADRIASASVIAPDCATADALSTAFSVMAPRDSVALADALPGVACLLVEHHGVVNTNAAWRARAVQPPDTISRRS